MKRYTHIVNGRRSSASPLSGLRFNCADSVAFAMLWSVIVLHVSDLVARFVAFIRSRYPHGVPQTDYIPLLALLRRRLSDDIGVAITRITDELASPADLDRVQRRLETTGWPVDPDA
jgi:Protein of unknown function (DUF3349)